MAQAIIEQIVTQEFGGDDDDPLTITLPTGITAGEKLFSLIALTEPRYNGAPTGWDTELDFDGDQNLTLVLISRTADGGEGVSIDVDLTSPSRAAAITWRVSGWTDYEVYTSSNGIGDSPDPPSATFSWGDSDTLVIPVMVTRGSSTEQSINGYPSDYTENQTSENTINETSNDAFVALASQGVSASSEDPGVFTLGSASFAWIANTLAIQGTASNTTGMNSLVGMKKRM